MDSSNVLFDSRTGLHAAWYFWLRVLDEVNRSARYGFPFGLLLLAAELPGDASRRNHDEAAGRVGRVIRTTDLGGALGSARVGVLLPFQDVTSARRAEERILSELEHTSAPGVRWRPQLLNYPADGAEISNLLTTGWTERPIVADSV